MGRRGRARASFSCSAAAAAATSFILLGGVVAPSSSSVAEAATVNWIDPAGGNFTDGGNWSGGAAPGGADDAVFNLASTYTTTFDTSPTNTSLAVQGGNVSFVTDGTARTYTVSGAAAVTGGSLTLGPAAATLLLSAGSVAVDPGAQLLVMNGNDVTTTGGIALGTGTGGTIASLIRLSGPGTTMVQSGGGGIEIGNTVGASTLATLELSAAASFTAGTGQLAIRPSGKVLVSGGNFNANGSILVDGGTLQRTSGSLSIPSGVALTAQNGGQVLPGTGGLNVRGAWSFQSGANYVSTAFLDVGNGSGTVGSLVVDGSGTTVAIGGGSSFWGSAGGSASVTVRNQATMTTGGSIGIANGTVPGTNGSLIVNSGGSLSGNAVNVATGGTTGALTVGDGGALTSTLTMTNLTVGHAVNGSGTVTINSGGAINATGGLTVNGTGQFHLNSGGSTTFGGAISVNGAGGGGTAAQMVIDAPLTKNGSGTVTVGHFSTGQGLLLVRNTFNAGSGTTQVNATGDLSIQNGGLYTSTGTVAVNGGDLIVANGGSINLPADRDINAMNGGRVLLQTPTFATNVQVTSSARLDATAGTFTLSGAYMVSSGGRIEITDGTPSVSPTAGVFIGTGTTFGQINVVNGGRLITHDLVLADAAGSNGYVTMAGATSTVNVSGQASVGGTSATGGVGGLQIAEGTVTIDNLHCWNNGWVTIQQGGTLDVINSFTNNGAFLFSDGTFRLRNQVLDVVPGGLLGANVSLTSGQNLVLDQVPNVAATGSIAVNGGSLTIPAFPGSGSFAFNAGTLHLTLADLDVAPGQPLGANINLASNKTLIVGGVTRIEASSSLTLNGGTFSTGNLVRNGLFTFNTGTFKLTAAALTIGPSGFFGSTLTLNPDRHVHVTVGTTIDATGQLYLPGGTFSGPGTVTNNGQIRLDSPIATLAAFLENNKLVTGTGRISAYMNNNGPSGEVRVGAGQELQVDSGTNTGRINVTDGAIEFTNSLNNMAAGQINGRGRFAFGPLQNNGQVQLSGGISDVFGAVTNQFGGKVIVSGNATATFYDAVTLNSGSEFRVSTGSTAVFFGNVTGFGAGSFTGSGTKIFEGGSSSVEVIATTTGSTVVEPGAEVTASRVREAALTVNGEVRLAPDGGTSRVGALTIGDDGATLDLGNNKLIAAAGDVGTASGGTYGGLQGHVQRAYNFGSWDGPGLTTSMPEALEGVLTIGVATGEQIRGLGPTDTDSWAGETINGASLIAMYTYSGDANLDGQVDAGDYGILDAFIQVAGASGYGNGDFNYDGFIDAADYGTIDNSIQFQGPPIFTSGGAGGASLGGVTAVPEPAATAALLMGGVLLRRRRAARKDGGAATMGLGRVAD